MRYDRWPTREERARMREEITKAGGILKWLKRANERPSLTDEERARHAAANAVADEHGQPRPYPDLDLFPRKESQP